MHVKHQAKKFDKWTNSEKNYEKSVNGEAVADQPLFNFNASTYSSDLNEFSQAYIKRYDENKDGVWSKEEFINMATNGKGTDDTTGVKEFFDNAFANLNLDEDEESISSEEFATMLYMSDLDIDHYLETGDIASSLDGKVNYNQYQGLSSLTDEGSLQILKEERMDFFNNFYAKKADEN
ncbi:MAG: hypothetical protein II972_05985 [Elusimicrobiaceae bacterium]|nr:hypothetical protein [Elusimicrobiaceae bacterium]